MPTRSESRWPVGLIAAGLLVLSACTDGAFGDGDGRYDAGGSGGSGSTSPCRSNEDCPSGHRCVVSDHHPEPTLDAALDGATLDSGAGDEDGGSSRPQGVTAPPEGPQMFDELPVGRCGLECEQALCSTGSECVSPARACERVDCGRYVRCPDSASPLYCDIAHHTCHRESGVCGLVGNQNYGCPKPSAWTRSGVSIRCDQQDGDSVGTCRFDVSRPLAPILHDDDGNEIPRTLEFVAPDYGSGVADPVLLELAFSGSSEVAFVVIMHAQPRLADEIVELADWAAALPRSARAKRRKVSWSAGHQLIEGAWQDGPGKLEPGKSYYAFAVAVVDGQPVAQSDELLLFQIGPGYPTAAKTACDEDITDPAAAAAACYHPTDVLACIAGRCERLCLSRDDCSSQHGCELDETLGVRYCR